MAESGYTGQQLPGDTLGEFNATRAIAQAMIARINTCTLVQIVSVTNAGELSPVGFVDVSPLVNQLDGAAKSTPHGIVHSLPYFRLQGGANAVILDPQVGDIGIAVFADRDISAVSSAKAAANPGSGRRFDMSDGLYLGGVLNGVPSQYVQFNATGVTVRSPSKITLSAPLVEVAATTKFNVISPASEFSGTVTIRGLLTWVAGMAGSVGSGVAAVITGAIQFVGTLTSNGKRIDDTHTHSGVQTGGGSTGGVN